jgi:hypothetical protein
MSVRKKEEMKTLECLLTDQEKQICGKDIAEALSKKRGLEDRLKSISTQIKAEITSFDAQINVLSEKINTGREFREVKCEIVCDYENGTKRTVRTDTWEIIKETGIPYEDLQGELELDPS